jgi:hypothetical protein
MDAVEFLKALERRRNYKRGPNDGHCRGGVMERLTKRGTDGQAMMDCEKCKADWTGKHGKPMVDCTALYCRNRLLDRLVEYEDTGLSPQACAEAREAGKVLSSCDISFGRLAELLTADKDGRLVVLPCKVGDTVWVTRNPWTGKLLKKPLDAYVNGMKMYSHGLYVNLLFDTRKINGTRDYEINHIGKTVFLTHEEAEKALEAMKDDWIETLPVLRRRSNT